jgi:hypothetical protein
MSDILEILGSSYACLTESTSTDMHSRLPELQEQVLGRMSDHSHSITIMTSELGMQHPFVIKHSQEHSSLEVIVSTLVEMVWLGSLHKDIEEILTRITRWDMHSSQQDLKDHQDQVLSLLSDYSHGITNLTNQLGKEHPLVVMSKRDYDSLEETVNNLLESVGRVQSTVAPTNLKSGPVILSTSGPVQPEESQLLASPAYLRVRMTRPSEQLQKGTL